MGMEYWMIGTIEWSFASKRYFGEQHEVIKCSRVVTLYPRKDTALPSLIASH